MATTVTIQDNARDKRLSLAQEEWEDLSMISGRTVKRLCDRDDGGVDAVVFDPDPLRGGKIVIQAKRYTNTVGVSAVRDLYGTVINEGANTGILITTSDYGHDSYEFAKDKPLKLLNGGHLRRFTTVLLSLRMACLRSGSPGMRTA